MNALILLNYTCTFLLTNIVHSIYSLAPPTPPTPPTPPAPQNRIINPQKNNMIRIPQDLVRNTPIIVTSHLIKNMNHTRFLSCVFAIPYPVS